MCTLRAGGKNFDADAFLKTSALKPCSVRRRGHLRSLSRPRGPKNKISNINFTVSNAGWTDFNQQVSDVLNFLRSNNKEIRRLARFSGVEKVELDFPVEVTKNVWNGNTDFPCALPVELLKNVAALGLGLKITIYTGQNNEDEP